MRNRILTALATLACVGFIVDGAQARIMYYHGSGDFSTGANWYDQEVGGTSYNSVPTAGDRAIVPNSAQVAISAADASPDSFEVKSGGLMTVAASKTLKILANSTVAETRGLRLSASGATLRIDDDATIDGAGSIEGRHNSAAITIDSGETLTLAAKIEGALQIGSAGAFVVNNGVMEANHTDPAGNDYLLQCADGTFTGAGVFRVNDADAVLRFEATVDGASTSADFELLSGTLDINRNVIGDELTLLSGQIRVATNMSLSFP